GELISVRVNTTDGTLTVGPRPITIPGSEVLTTFRITGSKVNVALLRLPGEPVDQPGNPFRFINEVFAIDGDNVLQLTNFGRFYTAFPTLSADGQRVIFVSTTNQLGTNPTEDCQLFSIDRIGGGLRQLTNFHEGPEVQHPTNGCALVPPPLGCGALGLSRDTQSGALVFDSSCDPFGRNPFGTALFAMDADGTGLRQLTETRGYTVDASGEVSVELAFPFAHPGLAVQYNYSAAPAVARSDPSDRTL